MKPEIGLEIQGRYELVERIAIGGMGEVWRATDLRSGRAVAAKILRPELTGDEIFLARLRAEAANSRGLRHPNLAVVLDGGEQIPTTGTRGSVAGPLAASVLDAAVAP